MGNNILDNLQNLIKTQKQQNWESKNYSLSKIVYIFSLGENNLFYFNGQMNKGPLSKRTSLKDSKHQWMSLADRSPIQNINQTVRTQPNQKQEINRQLEFTSIIQNSSILEPKTNRNEKRMRFTDLEEFQKENFPGKNIAETSTIILGDQIQFQRQTFFPRKYTLQKQRTQLQLLAKNLEVFNKESKNCLGVSQEIFSKRIQIINEYYKQLHLVLDIQKNKHHNNILILKKNLESRMKIASQASQIYLEEVKCILKKIDSQLNFEVQNYEKSINKIKAFLVSNQQKDLDIYQFQVKNIEEIKQKFSKLIEIEKPIILGEVGPRRQKSQSMGPRLKILCYSKSSQNQVPFGSKKHLVIVQQGDVNYTDNESSSSDTSRYG